MGEESKKTNDVRHLGGGRTSPFKCCKTSFVNNPYGLSFDTGLNTKDIFWADLILNLSM
jgi:hypothetical protein